MSPHHHTSIVVAGHVCLDINPSFHQELRDNPMQLFSPGRLNIVDAAVLSTGGTVSNTGLALTRMGLPTRLVGKVGDDGFGDLIRARFAEYGAESSMCIAPGEASSYSVVLAVPGIDRIFFHCPGCNDTFLPEDISDDVLKDARWFHFGYPPLMQRFYEDGGTRLASLMARAQNAGAATSLDMAYPDPDSPAGKVDWKTILAKTLPHVDLFMPSVEEVLIMLDKPLFETRRHEFAGKDLAESLPMADITRLADMLLEMGCGNVLLKCGIRGLFLQTGSKERLASIPGTPLDPTSWSARQLWHAPFDAKVVNATGSGDCAIAGFLAAVNKGETPEMALRISSVAGWRNIQTPDTLSGITEYASLRSDAETLTAVLKPTLTDAWKKSTQPGLWTGPHDHTQA